MGAWVTDKQLAWVKRSGGSTKLRDLIEAAMLQERQARAAARPKRAPKACPQTATALQHLMAASAA